MKKNDIIELSIVDMTHEGNGIGRHEGCAVFVPHTAPGDVVRVKIIKTTKSYAVGHLEEVLTPSGSRISPDCAVWKPCGGCCYRHISYEAECAIKLKRVNDCLERLGGVSCRAGEILPSPITVGYRNKAQYPIGLDKDGNPVLGFYAPKSHRIVPVKGCGLQPKEFDLLCDAFLHYVKQYGVSVYNSQTGKGLLRHFYLRMGFATKEIMVCVVATKNTLPHQQKLIESLRQACPMVKSIMVNVNKQPTNVILGNEIHCIYGKDTITDLLMDVPFTLSAHSFYQVNPKGAALLFQRAADYAKVTAEDTVVDLYCGTGAVGFCAGKQAGNLIGVEVVPQAVENAKGNAANMGKTNAEFLCMDAAEAAKLLAKRGVTPTVVFVDPPRKGCDQQVLETIAIQFTPKRLVYISCDPATLARDAAYLQELGYYMKEATAVDMFPRTPHVETVAWFQKEGEPLC